MIHYRLQIWADVVANVAELVTDGAEFGEGHRATRGIASERKGRPVFLHDRRACGNDVGVESLFGEGFDARGGMVQQTSAMRGIKCDSIDLPVCDALDQLKGPLFAGQ